MNRIFDNLDLTPAYASEGSTSRAFGGPGAGTRLGDSTLLFASGSDDKETVTVQRRRRTSPGGPTERAEAPKRRETSGGSAPPPPPQPPSGGGGYSGGGSPSSSGGSGGGMGLPGGGGGLSMLGLIAVLLLCGAVFFFSRLFGGGGGAVPAQLPGIVEEAAQQQPQQQPGGGLQVQQPPAARPTATPDLPSATEGEPTWLIMLYQDADDKILEKDIFIDLNEAERVGSGGNVHVVSQIDRYQGGFSGDGNWTSTKRFYLTQDDNLNRIGSQELMDLGEQNMADANTLIDFVTWAVEAYPADRHVLILSDHGMGWPGGWTDPTAPRRSGENVPLANRLGDQLYLNEIDAALGEIRQRTGIDKFELFGMDACLMGHLEVMSALEPHARYAVVSQETEPAVGWAYAAFLAALRQNPGMSGAELGEAIVRTYIDEDERIVDNEARLDMTGSRGMFGAPDAATLADQMQRGTTLAAVDLAQVPALMDRFNELAYALQQVNQRGVSQARSYSQSFTSIFGQQVPPSYIDLGHFVQLITESTRDRELLNVTDAVRQAIDDVVVAERHGSGKPGATGISIYFPNSNLYGNPVAGPPSYVPVAERFAQESLWDDFLAYHYTQRRFDPAAQTAVASPADTPVEAPAAGGISVSPIRASSNVASPNNSIQFEIDIAGENIGYIKLFVGYIDEASRSIFMADQDYLESPETREVNGIYYPVWPEEEFTMAFAWDPVVFAIDDHSGEGRVQAMLEPLSYGATYEDTVYAIDGIYTYGDDGEQRAAQAHFRDGVLVQILGFHNDEDAGAPREILPQSGDRFTVIEQWLDLDASGRQATPAQQSGQTLTYNGTPWVWQDLIAAEGEYVVGFIIEDLDGNTYPIYTQIRVE